MYHDRATEALKKKITVNPCRASIYGGGLMIFAKFATTFLFINNRI
jgi:hypothetical protein